MDQEWMKKNKVILIIVLLAIVVIFIYKKSENFANMNNRLNCGATDNYCYPERGYIVGDTDLMVKLVNNPRIASTWSKGRGDFKKMIKGGKQILNFSKVGGTPTLPHSEQIIANFMTDILTDKIGSTSTNTLFIYQTKYFVGNDIRNFLSLFLVSVEKETGNKKIYLLKDPNNPDKEYLLRINIKKSKISDTSNKTHSETFFKLYDNGIKNVDFLPNSIISFTIEMSGNKTENKSFLLVELN